MLEIWGVENVGVQSSEMSEFQSAGSKFQTKWTGQKKMIQLQLIELCPLNSSSSQFWRVRVAEVVDELMTEGVKWRHRANPCWGGRDVLVGIPTTEIQGKLLFKYSVCDRVRVVRVMEVWRAVSMLCKVRSNVRAMCNTRSEISSLMSEEITTEIL